MKETESERARGLEQGSENKIENRKIRKENKIGKRLISVNSQLVYRSNFQRYITFDVHIALHRVTRDSLQLNIDEQWSRFPFNHAVLLRWIQHAFNDQSKNHYGINRNSGNHQFYETHIFRLPHRTPVKIGSDFLNWITITKTQFHINRSQMTQFLLNQIAQNLEIRVSNIDRCCWSLVEEEPKKFEYQQKSVRVMKKATNNTD